MTRSFFQLILLVGTFCTVVFTGCTKCPVNLPYLDVKEIDIVAQETSLSIGEPLYFNILYKSIQYLTAKKGVRQIPYNANALYAATCEADGQLGLKYLITSVDIFANVNWNSDKPTGTSLAEYLEVGVFNSEINEYTYVSLPLFLLSHPNGFDPEDMLFRLIHSPSVSGDIFLTLILSKSDATTLSQNLPIISWN